MMNLQNTQFLTKEQIRSKASSVFTDHGSQNTSEKYTRSEERRVGKEC
jgi:hypothetical protein